MRKKIRGPARLWVRCALGCSGAVVAGFGGTPASAQQSEKPRPPRTAEKADAANSDIVVTGQRGSAVTDIEPLATFDASTIAGVGATAAYCGGALAASAVR